MSRRLLLGVSALPLFFTCLAFAELPICQGPICYPDTTASSYPGAVAARPMPLNTRGQSSAAMAVEKIGGTRKVLGSQSYNYAIPVLRLPGRNGLNLDLNLYYNSRIWNVDSANHTATFNIDRDFPSYGFRLDFGYIEQNGSTQYILTKGDGTKIALVQSSGSTYYATDGSGIQYNSYTAVLLYKNGLAVWYYPFPSTNQSSPSLLRPTRLTDSNGNYISITYVSGYDQLISTITDTLGRVITFNYDSSHRLVSIAQQLQPSGTKTYVSFSWGTIYGTNNYAWYNFSGLSVHGVSPLGTPLNVIIGCTYPNSAGYRFTYGDWGIITKIENLSAASTPATRSYNSYNYPLASAGALTDVPAYTQETVSPDGTSANASTWNYTWSKSGVGIVSQITVKDPLQNISTTNLNTSGFQAGLPSSIQSSDSSSTLQREADYTWTQVGATPQSTVLSSVVNTLKDTGQQSKITYGYDAFSNVTDVYEYDFGLTLKRHTVTSYLTTGYYNQVGTTYIVDRPTQVLVEDASGNTVARTDLAYDNYTAIPMTSVTGAANHADRPFSSSYTIRGNLTSFTRYSNAAAGTGGVTRGIGYDTLGNQVLVQLDCCSQKTFNFSSTTQYSLPDSIVRGPTGGPQFTTGFSYDPNNSSLLSTTDENGQVASFQYDSMVRQTQVQLPPQSGTYVQLNTAYDDIDPSPSITQSNTANSAVEVTTLDGLGHVMQVDKKNGSTLVSTVKSTYDQLWRRTQVTNPYAPSDTVFNTTYSYDSLGRLTEVAPPSGGNRSYSYSGNAVTVTDPAGKQRTSVSDALGRLIEVDEPGEAFAGADASGSIAIGGSLQTKSAIPATHATGTFTVTGAEQSQSGVGAHPGTAGTGTVSINGYAQCSYDNSVCDMGQVWITVNGFSDTTQYSSGSPCCSNFIDSQLVAQSQADNNPYVTVTTNGSGVTLTAKATGANTNYSLSAGSSYDNTDSCLDSNGNTLTPCFTQPSFTATPSGATLTGGTDAYAGTTVYDSGTCTATINGTNYSVNFGQGDTPTSIAAALAARINSGSLATASASGGTISATTTATGSGSNYPVKGGNCSYNSSYFSGPSFVVNPTSTTNLTGGTNGSAAITDSGTVTVSYTVPNSATVTATATYGGGSGQDATAAAVASDLASKMTSQGSQLAFSASNGTLNIVSPVGSKFNLTVNCTSATNQPGTFSGPSFTCSGTTLSGGSDPYGSGFTHPYVTTYTYDLLNNLVGLSQAAGNVNDQFVAGQPRSYAYDSLGRITTATTPESGVVTTFYTTSSGGTCAGDPGLPCRIQDARGIVKTFSYDGINRPSSVTYSDGTPSVTYQYDAGGATAFALTRLTKITEGTNSRSFTYDNLGRMTSVSQVIDGTTYPIQYGYNFASALTSITYPTGRVVSQNVDAAGRLASITDPSANYLSNLTYNAAGETLGFTMGNQVQGAFTYNDHLELATLRYFKSGATTDVLNLAYDYTTGVPGNNGQIQAIHYYTSPGAEDKTKSEEFTYDALGRLSTAQTGTVNSTPGSGTWSLRWTYDRLGNRLQQSVVNGDPNLSIGQPNLQVDVTTNRIVGYCYDAAGNLLDQAACPAGSHTYAYDGANRLTQINGGSATYTYFGMARIKKVNGGVTTVYVYSGGKPIVEYANGSLSKEYIYAGSLLATIAGGATTYHHPDHLSNRAETDASGNVVRTFGHFPFGETWYETGTADKWKFTSYERDSGSGETGLDYATFRYYSSSLGRFMSADPLGGRLRSPQSLNRYAYAQNDPINGTDPTGMLLEDDCPLCVDVSWVFSGGEGWGLINPLDVPDDFNVTTAGCYCEISPEEIDSLLVQSLPELGTTDLSSIAPAETTTMSTGTMGTQSSDAFEEGSLAYQVFGPPSHTTWNSAYNWAVAAEIGTGAVLAAPAAISAAGAGLTALNGLTIDAYFTYVNLSARAYGLYLGSAGAAGVTLGQFDAYTNYITASQMLGTNVLNVSEETYTYYANAGAFWTLNEGFLEASILRGQQFYMSSPVLGASGSYAWELEYLISRGVGPSQWATVPW